MKIVDCFIFYNEFDLLKYRLHLLNEVVDYFILVESTHTHVGTEKQLYYQENKHLFEKFNHKIIHIIVNDFPYQYPNMNVKKQHQWVNEKFQRNAISRGIQLLDTLDPSDVIIITDVDEIPDPRVLESIQLEKRKVDLHTLQMDFYYYNLRTQQQLEWTSGKMISYEKYKELRATCDDIRFMKCPMIKCGWHLSYFGDESFISNKIKHFTHQELNNAMCTNEIHIAYSVQQQMDLYGRPLVLKNIPLEENPYLPPNYSVYLKKYC